jgi:hypothetical protein
MLLAAAIISGAATAGDARTVPSENITTATNTINALTSCVKQKAIEFSVLTESPEAIANASLLACKAERARFWRAADGVVLADDPTHPDLLNRDAKIKIFTDGFEAEAKNEAIAAVFTARSAAAVNKPAVAGTKHQR